MGRLDLPDPVRDEDLCFCDTVEEGWRPCPPPLCERDDHEHEGPDTHDCPTAAHLRSCGFCRAAIGSIAAEAAAAADARVRAIREDNRRGWKRR